MKTNQTVIHLIQSLNSGGCENMLLRTLPLLSQEFEHQIVTLKEPGELAERFVNKGVKLSNLGSRGWLDLAHRHKLSRFINAQKPALVITYLFHADVAGRLLLQKQISAPVISFLRTTYNFRRYWPARIFEKLTRLRARHYFANSKAVKEYYVSHIGVAPNKITVIPNGIDTSLYKHTDDNQVVRELKLPPKRIVISCVANLALNKGHKYLLEAFEDIFSHYSEAFLLIVGEGPERVNLEHKIETFQSKGHIKFLGRRSDVTEILSITDIFVLPTLFEGMSNALLEAMAAGCAVITTDIAENRVIIKNKQTGLLVPTESSAAIATAIMMLLKDQLLRHELGRNAKEFIKVNFDLQAVAKQWEQVIKVYARD